MCKPNEMCTCAPNAGRLLVERPGLVGTKGTEASWTSNQNIKRRPPWDSEKAHYSGLSVCHCRSFCSLRCSCTTEETNAAARRVKFLRDRLGHSVIAKRVARMIGAGTIKSGRSRSHIDINDPAAVRRWSRHLRLTKSELLCAVDKVGNSVVAVRKQINLVERR
jgi:hypothetical protein